MCRQRTLSLLWPITGITQRITRGYQIQTNVEHHVSHTMGHLLILDTARMITIPLHRCRFERAMNTAASSSEFCSIQPEPTAPATRGTSTATRSITEAPSHSV